MKSPSTRGASVVILCASAAFAQSVPMFRGDLAHTGIYQGTAPAKISHVRWQFKTGGRIFSSPVVAGGRVYVGSDDHFLHTIEEATGKEAWKFHSDANVSSTPAVAHGSVFFVGLDGNAYALDAQTGKLVWKFKTGGESRLSMAGLYGLAPSREVHADPWDFLTSSPSVSEGVVYFGSGDHNVYALDEKTGQLRWKFQAGDVVHSSPAIVEGVVYIGCWDGNLYALNAKTGVLQWKFATGTDQTHFMQGIPGSPAVTDGVVVFGSRDNRIYALDAASGKLLWKSENDGSWVISSPAILNGVVYETTSDTMKFRVLDLKNGKPLYDLVFKAYSFSSPAIAGGHAYFGTFDGCVYDVELASHQFNSHFCVKAAQDNKQFLTEDGHLNQELIFGPMGADGQPNNTLDATVVGIDRLLQLGAVLASPSVANGVVYAASVDGSVYALD